MPMKSLIHFVYRSVSDDSDRILREMKVKLPEMILVGALQ